MMPRPTTARRFLMNTSKISRQMEPVALPSPPSGTAEMSTGGSSGSVMARSSSLTAHADRGGSTSCVAHPWVDHGVQDVGEQRADDDRRAGDNRDAHEHWVVVGGRRVPEQQPHSRIIEDGFGDDL